jgi:hypothetical protein
MTEAQKKVKKQQLIREIMIELLKSGGSDQEKNG